MKHKKSYLNKFRRKYVFLQNSLADFLHWRTFEYSTTKDSISFENLQKKSQQTAFLLSEEKISLQEYWKSSEQKKIENSIENMNKEFNISFLFKDQKVRKSEEDNLLGKNISPIANEQISNKNGEFDQSFLKNATQRRNNSQKRMRFSFYSSDKNWKVIHKKRNKKSSFPLFHLKKGMSSGQKQYSFNTETFIPKSDCFRKVQNLPFFLNSKIGHFFPKKKTFMQYWIFPVLGFVVFFSSPSSFFDFKKKSFFEKKDVANNILTQKTAIDSFTFSSSLKNANDPKKFFGFSSKQSSLKTKAPSLSVFSTGSHSSASFHFLNQSLFQDRVLTETLAFQQNDPQQNLESQIFDFAYSDVVSRETYKQFKKLEKNEFRNLCHFYLNFFKDSLWFFTDEKQNEIFKKSSFEFWYKNSVERNRVRQTIETNRNIFHWKWFSLKKNFYTFEQKNKFLNLCVFKIPQKAQFFLPNENMNEKFFFFSFDNCFSNSLVSKKSLANIHYKGSENHSFFEEQRNFSSKLTPVFDFTKSRFLINEFERNMSVFPKVFDGEISHLFAPFCFSNKNILPGVFFPIPKDGGVGFKVFENTVQKEKTKKVKFSFENFIFLEKWLQTQKFWNVKRNGLLEKNFSSPFFDCQNISVFKDPLKEKNFVLVPTKNFVLEKSEPLLQMKGKNISIKSLSNLDSLYLQKIFGFLGNKANFGFQSTHEFLKNKNGSSFSFISNSSKFPNRESSSKFKENFLNRTFLKKKHPLSFCLKKHTFEFFVFQYYKKNFLKFLKPFLFKTNKNFDTLSLSHLKDKVNWDSSFFKEEQKAKEDLKEKSFENMKKRKAFFCFFQNSKTNTKLLHSFSLKSFVFMRKILSLPSFVFHPENKAVSTFLLRTQSSFNKKPFLDLKKTEMYRLNPSSLDTFLNNRVAQKETLKIVQKDITNLELPILLDFSEKKQFEDDFFSKEKNFFKNEEAIPLKKPFLKKNFFSLNFSLKNFESSQSPYFSSYFVLKNNEKNSIFKLPNFPFFNIFTKSFLQLDRKTLKEEKGKNMENSNEELFPKTFIFSCSKTGFFDTLSENTLKKFKTHFFSLRSKFSSFNTKERSFSEFLLFKKSFWLEKVKNEQPFVFKTHSLFGKNFPFQNEKSSNVFFQKFSFWNENKVGNCFFVQSRGSTNKKSFGDPSLSMKKFPFNQKYSQEQKKQTFKENSFFLKSTKSFVLKHKVFFLNQPKTYFQTKLKKYKKDFSNFQSRKFEKIFQMFFSPLNKENFSFSKVSLKQYLHQQTLPREKNFLGKRYGNRSLQSKKAFFKDKIQKNSFLLQTLSTSLQSQFKKTSSSFFLSVHSEKNQRKFLYNNKNESLLLKRMNSIAFSKTQQNFQGHQENKVSVKNKKSIGPSFLLKRDGFVIVPKKKFFKTVDSEHQKQENNIHSLFTRELNLSHSNTQETYKRLDKEKALQKKRRLKKQKLETRRRKKRKRFFPRPLWLRFHLYKKFLKNRHPENDSRSTFLKTFPTEMSRNNPQNSFSSFVNISSFKNSTLFKSQNEFEQKKIYRKNRQKWGFYWKNGLQEKILYKKFPQLNQKPNLSLSLQNSPISQNKEQYKISGEILSEFLRLSWKSYWFQTNFIPYTRQITENFKKMKSLESQKNLSEYNLFDFLVNVPSATLFRGFPLFEKNMIDSSQNDYILKKSLLKKFSWYWNFQSSLDSNPLDRSLLLEKRRTSLNFQKIQNSPEYNRILYSRVSEILRNFKSSEFNDENFLRESQKNLKIPRHKNEPTLPTSSFFTKSALFYENFTVPSQPSIPAFSMFSSLFQNHSIKPTGELPTLRALWALHQTNFYHFQEKNNIRNLWTLKKRTESLKSLKGTKQLVSTLRKYSGLEKLNAPKLGKHHFFALSDKNLERTNSIEKYFEGEDKQKLRLSNENLKTKPLQTKDYFQKTFDKNQKENSVFPEELMKKKYLFLSTLHSGFTDFVEHLDAMSLKKFMNVQQKCSVFGIHTLKQNSRISLRYLKFHLLSNASKKNFYTSIIEEQFSSNRSAIAFPFSSSKRQFSSSQLQDTFNTSFMINKPNQQNSAKSSLNFWWSQKNFTPFQFFFSSQTKSFLDFDALEFSFFFGSSAQKTTILSSQPNESSIFPSFFYNSKNGSTEPFFVEEQKELLQQKQENSNFFGIESQFVWCGALLFHLALFFSLLKLPEIRSVLKFQCVLLYKFFNAFFTIVFSIYNLCQKYTNKGTTVAKKILQASSMFSQKKEKKSFEGNLFFSSGELQNFASKPMFATFPFFSSSFYRFSFRKGKIYAQFTKKDQLQKMQPKEQKNSINPFFATVLPSIFLKTLQTKSFQTKRVFQTNFEKNSKAKFLLSRKKGPSENIVFVPKKEMFLFKSSRAFFFEVFVRLSKFSSVSSFENSSKNRFRLVLKPKRGYDQVHFQTLKTLETLSIPENFICKFALSFLLFGKSATLMSYHFVHLSSKVSAKILDFVEMVMFSVYKFLEKPAEFMIEWIALIFLIEWSSDIATFVPDTLDIAFSKSSRKFYRPLRSGSLIFSFLTNRNILFVSSFSSVGPSLPSAFLHSFEFFTYANITSFALQKRFLYFFEHFSSVLTQPDMDIFVRQRKGMIFWDIWAEILLKAAEKYNVNIPSFVTLKEEQELFIEKLLQDCLFLKNLQAQNVNHGLFSSPFLNNKFPGGQKNEKSFRSAGEFMNSEMIQQNSLSSFIENFLIKERSKSFSNFVFFTEKKKTQQLSLFDLCASSTCDSSFFTNRNKASFFLPHQLKSSFSFLFRSRENFLSQEGGNGNVDKGMNALHQKLSPFFKKSLMKRNFYKDFLTDSFGFEKFTGFDRWSCHQYGTYQGPETDLFVDIHPPKSLKQIQFLKYYEPAQYTLGSLICQIYSGIFSKQVSKNILVIGSPGTAKTLFIQALAGETEMKIITDNAYRYSMVQRGVAVGMKYLRDVFDALALQTPCFFLMEHIHVIGSKRPLLISDDENVKGIQSSFGLDQQEVHETNQMIYQLNRHSITDYKRPYKGDFSMSIPTNFFLQNFYLNSEKTSTSIFKNDQFAAGGVNSFNRTSPTSPLPIDSIESSLVNQGLAEKEKTDAAFVNSFENTKKGYFSFQSRLQISKEQIFAPPATSPFTVLMMKEQKKLKPKKIVQESSWGGLSTDQMISYQKENSSVRAKVAVLADITMNLSRGKLDMITDLLVIIDSVRSNRGFVVFATTHLPSLLDPALRRPGRFDETISLAQSPNFLNRFEILKMHFENSLTTLDFLDSSIFTEDFSEMNLLNFITATKLSFFHQYKYTAGAPKTRNKEMFLFQQKLFNKKQLRTKFAAQKRILSQINPSKGFKSFLKSSFFQDLYMKKRVQVQKNDQRKIISSLSSNRILNKSLQNKDLFKESFNTIKESPSFHSVSSKQNRCKEESFHYFLRDSKLLNYTILSKGPSHTLSLAYSKIGIFLAKCTFANDPNAFIPLSLDTNSLSASFLRKNQSFLRNTFYDSQKEQKIQLMVFLSGKIAEFFIQKNTKVSFDLSFQRKELFSENARSINSTLDFVSRGQADLNSLQKPFDLFTKKFSVFLPQKIQKREKVLRTPDNSTFFSTQAKSPLENKNSSLLQKNDFFWTAFGNDSAWRSATPFLFSILQKRFLFTKNLLLSKMLFFDNKNQRKQPPSPPNSSILMPSKKYENFKRSENDFVQKGRFSINEKIQMHQQQRFLKQLYNIPVQQYFRSEMIENRKTLFSSSFQELAYLDSFTRRASSSHFYHQKYLGIRHRFSNVNQWWNGFLPEHNTETTYLSDVDWRTMFGIPAQIQKKVDQVTPLVNKQSDKSTFRTFEFTMDFPDAEQYYNPRNRRWYFHGKLNQNFFCFQDEKANVFDSNQNLSSSFTFDTTLQYEIYYHYLMQSFHETFQYLDQNREMFDFFVFHLLRKGFLKELDYLTTISRFQLLEQTF